MNSRLDRIICIAGVLAATGIALPAMGDEFEQHGAHEHGKLSLSMSVEGGQLVIELDSPAANVIGFEHAPTTDAEKLSVANASIWLKSGRGLFLVPAAARCALVRVAVEEPEWTGEHADYEATFTYQCAAPKQLAWLEPLLLSRLINVAQVRVNLITASGQRSEVVTSAATRIALQKL